MNVVWVLEEKPPEGEAPLEWILLTTLPISTQEEIRLVMDNYTTRWMIEIYHRVLKSGCRVEDRRFETLPRMLNCMAIYMVVAWRILFMCWLGRNCPEMPCDVVFDDAEWQAVYKVLNPKKKLPAEPPQ